MSMPTQTNPSLNLEGGLEKKTFRMTKNREERISTRER
jgi:hypothetical protein